MLCNAALLLQLGFLSINFAFIIYWLVFVLDSTRLNFDDSVEAFVDFHDVMPTLCTVD